MNIPSHVSAWLDEYFHKSAYDVPIKPPTARIIKFLSQFKKNHVIKLYRGINKYNTEDDSITSWTYNKKVAERYVGDAGGGRVAEKEFAPECVMLDTTLLSEQQRKLMGYDYQEDDREVLIIKSKQSVRLC